MQDKFLFLKKYFGYDSFRDGQETLIDSILKGEDVLGIMPTGAGKSICYQLPAVMLEGITLVISPLLSLMKDQVMALNNLGIRSAYINSSLSERQMYKALLNAKNGVYKIIYVAPERLELQSFLNFSQNANISMVAVDEAHCVSQWGQDFRQSYLYITDFINALPKRPVLSAFTATATKKVSDDICSLLNLKSPKILVNSFDRKNLNFQVRHPHAKFDELFTILTDNLNNSGIIYCSTRKNVDELFDKLSARNFDVTKYHAGLPDVERQENQEDFVFDKTKIIIATNAFGMGINKPNVAFVVHYNMPKDIESYYQEAGRAGRDSSPAQCILLFSKQDIATNKYLIENNFSLDNIDPELCEQLKKIQLVRLNKMINYCQTFSCLRQFILNYFGEQHPPKCDNCSSCNSSYVSQDIGDIAIKIFRFVAKYNHRFGKNLIIDCLRGSNNSKVKDFGLDKSSFYNTINLSHSQLDLIVTQLILLFYLNRSFDKYPVISVTNKALEFIENQSTLYLPINRNTLSTSNSKAKNTDDTFDQILFEQLKTLRSTIAKKQNVPPYVIFHDTTLKEMASLFPSSSSQLLSISGVGNAKMEKYGEEFLALIKNYTSSKNL